MEKVSVIMPAYNAGKTIAKAIRSVESQTYKNFELLIIDDGSNDETALISDSMSREDERVRVIHIENTGVSNARNVALKHCTGKYVAFIDADDQMCSDMLQIMMSAMLEDVDLVCAGYTVISSTGIELFSQKPVNSSLDRKHYDIAIADLQDKKALNPLWNKLFRRDIIENNKITMDPAVKMGEDFLFVIEYLTCMKKKIRCISNTIYKYTLSSQGAQATIKNKNAVRDRIDQLYKLSFLYNREKFSYDSIYAEQLRCIYTSLSETNDITFVLDMVYEDERNQEMLKRFVPENRKMRIFRVLLKSHSNILISCAVVAFKMLKKIEGKSYQWN